MGCWFPPIYVGFVQDSDLSNERKEEMFMLLGLPEQDLPTEEKEILKFEILAQDSPVEERLEFLLEGDLWQYCLKAERERFKQVHATVPEFCSRSVQAFAWRRGDWEPAPQLHMLRKSTTPTSANRLVTA